MLELYAPMFIMFAIVAVICTVMFAGGHFVGPKNPTPEKVMPFECGNDTPGARDVKMNVKFYLTAMLFVVFDVEIVFITLGPCSKAWAGLASSACSRSSRR